MSSNAHFLTLDPEIAPLIAQMPNRPQNLTIEEQRAALHARFLQFQERMKPELPSDSEYQVQDHLVPVDSGEIKVRCVMPISSGPQETGPFPLLVWYHGGGYCLGSSDMDDFYLRTVAVKNRVVVVNVDYRLAPLFPFPTGVNDAYAALKWVCHHICAPLRSDLTLLGRRERDAVVSITLARVYCGRAIRGRKFLRFGCTPSSRRSILRRATVDRTTAANPSGNSYKSSA